MGLLKVIGSPQVIERIVTDGKRDEQFWQVDKTQQIVTARGIHASDWLRRATNPGREIRSLVVGYDLYAADPQTRQPYGPKVPVGSTLGEHEKAGLNGRTMQAVWFEPREMTEEEQAEIAQFVVPGAEEGAEAAPAPATATEDDGGCDADAEITTVAPRPQPVREAEPPAALHGYPYLASERGWVPVWRKQAAAKEGYYLAIPKKDGGGHGICSSCVQVLQPYSKAVTWAAVDKHPAPVRPNTTFKKFGIEGKLSFDKNAKDGSWKIKSFGAGWKSRMFKVGPNGLHYYTARPGANTLKNSKIFTTKTAVLAEPLVQELKAKAKGTAGDGYHYFGLHFQGSGGGGGYEEALLMRVKDKSQKAVFLDFVQSTLSQLSQDEEWAKASNPQLMKDICSNYLDRISEYTKVAAEAREANATERLEIAALERQTAAARAETEHLQRGADRGEGEVAKVMAQIRLMTKGLEKEYEKAKRDNASALQQLADAKAAYDAAMRQTQGDGEALGSEAERMAALRRRVAELRQQRDAFVDDRNSVFARWRKMEESHGKKAAAVGPLVAFSPPDSVCHPVRLMEMTDVAANTLLKQHASPWRKPGGGSALLQGAARGGAENRGAAGEPSSSPHVTAELRFSSP